MSNRTHHTPEEYRRAELEGSMHVIGGEHKELRDCTVDEISEILDGIAGSIEDQAAELRSAVDDPDAYEGMIEDLCTSIDGDMRNLADIYAHRKTLR